MEIKRLYKEIEGANGRIIPMDIHANIGDFNSMPIVIFAHGYKGFKDFGAWDLIGDQFAEKGIVFIRFNFSHNGTLASSPLDFTDLKAFGENNYSIEVSDLNRVIEFVYSESENHPSWNKEEITLIGHSRGGGMVILAANNKKVNKLITWAAINNTFKGMPSGNELEKWKKDGVRYVLNGRTKQNMPHFYSFYEDLISNKDALNIENKAKELLKPWLIIHGDSDEAVPLEDGVLMNKWNENSALEIIQNGTHTFSVSHPWNKAQLPSEMQKVVNLSLNFILNT